MLSKKRKKQNTKVKAKSVRFNFTRIVRFFKLTLVSLAIFVALGASLFYGSKVVKQFLSKPITELVIEGEFNYLNKAIIEKMLLGEVKQSFIRESLVSVQNNIELHPWVDSVILRRQWPDRLHVFVVEQKPIAKWGDSGFVNYRGELFQVSGIDKYRSLSDDINANEEKIATLPVLYGNDNNALELMKQYQRLSEIVLPYGLSITELKENSLGVWTFKLNNGWDFIAGRDGITKKLQRVMAMLADNKIRRQDEINVIDMRYENGLAVRWKTSEQHAKNEIDAVKKVDNNI